MSRTEMLWAAAPAAAFMAITIVLLKSDEFFVFF
jgi:hypothetical protein